MVASGGGAKGRKMSDCSAVELPLGVLTIFQRWSRLLQSRNKSSCCIPHRHSCFVGCSHTKAPSLYPHNYLHLCPGLPDSTLLALLKGTARDSKLQVPVSVLPIQQQDHCEQCHGSVYPQLLLWKCQLHVRTLVKCLLGNSLGLVKETGAGRSPTPGPPVDDNGIHLCGSRMATASMDLGLPIELTKGPNVPNTSSSSLSTFLWTSG